MYLRSSPPLPHTATLNTVKNLPFISVTVKLRLWREDVSVEDTAGGDVATSVWWRSRVAPP